MGTANAVPIFGFWEKNWGLESHAWMSMKNLLAACRQVDLFIRRHIRRTPYSEWTCSRAVAWLTSRGSLFWGVGIATLFMGYVASLFNVLPTVFLIVGTAWILWHICPWFLYEWPKYALRLRARARLNQLWLDSLLNLVNNLLIYSSRNTALRYRICFLNSYRSFVFTKATNF